MPAHILARMPYWYIVQHRAIELREQKRREVDLVHSSLDLLCGADVRDSGWQEWDDAVAAMDTH